MGLHKALALLSLARKGDRIEVGEAPVYAITQAGKARLIVVASDASENTLRRVQHFVAGTQQPYLSIPFDKAALGQAVGRTSCAMAALRDPSLAAAFVRALDAPDAALLAQLTQAEQNAHRTQLRRGKKKS